MNFYGRLAAASVVLFAAGCVPISDYQALEDRFREQEEYVTANKDVTTEFEQVFPGLHSAVCTASVETEDTAQ